MNFEEWEPVYEQILADFGFDRTGDEHARDVLAELLREMADGQQSPHHALSKLEFEGETVAVAGAGPTLEDDLDIVEGASTVVAASDAARRLRELGYDVDCMVTDLDKTPETARTLTTEGVPVVVHAHGDNVSALESYVPLFDPSAVIPTTQARPTDRVRNFGGFTDGDRGAFLADELGAARLVFPGWAFDDPTVSDQKRQKLAWAARLLHWLEHRRDEQFAVLDDRRDTLDSLF